MSDPDQPTPRPPGATVRHGVPEKHDVALGDVTTPPTGDGAEAGGPESRSPGHGAHVDASATGRDPINAAPAHAGERVADIESLPLAERAAGYRALHGELAERLEQAPGDA